MSNPQVVNHLFTTIEVVKCLKTLNLSWIIHRQYSTTKTVIMDNLSQVDLLINLSVDADILSVD